MPSDELQPARTPDRPPGEIGGHTVQPWEQDAVPTTTSPNSKDVPPPQAGTKEAVAQGTGQGMKTTAAPGNDPSSVDPGEAAPAGYDQALQQAAQTEAPATTDEKSPGLTRPSRPPVYKPQTGHEPAPRPSSAPVTSARARGPPTDSDALIESITKSIADNLAKALHQSIAQALRAALPMSGQTLPQPKQANVDVKPNLRRVVPKAQALAPQSLDDVATPQESNTAPQVDPSAPAAANSADRETREGNLV